MNNQNLIVEFYKRNGMTPRAYSEQLLTVSLKNGVPEEQLKTLQRRGKNIITSGKWDSMTSEAHAKAFTVANVAKADIVQAIYKAVESAKKNGTPLKDFQKDLGPKLKEMGWEGATAGRLKTIYSTNMRMAYQEGEYRGMVLSSELYPFWQYHQLERGSKNPWHTQFNGRVFRWDDPIWQTIFPPSKHGCACWVTNSKNGANVESGAEILPELKNNPDFTISPLKAWEPDTTKYVSELRTQLESLLKKAPKAPYNEIVNKLKSNNIDFEINLKDGDEINLDYLDKITNSIIDNQHIAKIKKVIIEHGNLFDDAFAEIDYNLNFNIGYNNLVAKNSIKLLDTITNKILSPKVKELSPDMLIDYFIKHEMGHAKFSILERNLKEIDKLNKSFYYLDYQNEMAQIFKDYTKDYDPYEGTIPDHIFSKYSASRSNEMQAESIAMYESGLDKYNAYIKKIINLNKKYEKIIESEKGK